MKMFAVDLTPERVADQVAALRANHADAELAHSHEDAIHLTVLEAIAINRLSGVDAQRAALYAISTRDIDFPRWCA